MNGIHFYQDAWSNEPPRVAGPTDLGFWSSNSVFDGARAIRGCAPDLDRHCVRLIRSAEAIGLSPDRTAEDVLALCVEGIRALPADADYYVRPMFFCRGGRHPAGNRHDAVRSVDLRDAHACGERRTGDTVAVPPSCAGPGSDRRQGRVSVPEFAASPARRDEPWL